MALTQREAFKVGFLGQCADRGLSLDEAHQHIKQAIHHLELGKAGVAGAVGATARGLGGLLSGISSLAGTALMLPLVVGAPIGAGLGYSLAQLRGINDMTPEEITTNEKIEALRRAASRAKMRTRQDKKPKKSRRPRLLI